jgi:hypothetical protein
MFGPVNLALWAAFRVLDEVFLVYQPEGVHRAIFMSQIATLLLLHLLTDTKQQSGSVDIDEMGSGQRTPSSGSQS